MLVYWESLVWSVIANGVVYVKYKAYKAKLMVLNCQGVSGKTCVGHDSCKWGGHCACMAPCHCPPILSLIMLHYHGHSRLGYGITLLGDV